MCDIGGAYSRDLLVLVVTFRCFVARFPWIIVLDIPSVPIGSELLLRSTQDRSSFPILQADSNSKAPTC